MIIRISFAVHEVYFAYSEGCERMLEDWKPEMTALREKLNEMGDSL